MGSSPSFTTIWDTPPKTNSWIPKMMGLGKGGSGYKMSILASMLNFLGGHIFGTFSKHQTSKSKTRWWFQIFFIFISNFGEDEPILTNIFRMGWFNNQPEDDRLFLGLPTSNDQSFKA